MAEHVASVGIDVIGSILAEYARKIVDKAFKGERLSDWEVGFLLMEATRRTLDARMDAIEKRMDLIEKRMDMLEKRVEGIEADMKHLRASVDSLRDTVLMKIVEILTARKG